MAWTCSAGLGARAMVKMCERSQAAANSWEGIFDSPQGREIGSYVARRGARKRRFPGYSFDRFEQCSAGPIYSAVHERSHRARCEKTSLSSEDSIAFSERQAESHGWRDGVRHHGSVLHFDTPRNRKHPLSSFVPSDSHG